jgi:hypothetical protein
MAATIFANIRIIDGSGVPLLRRGPGRGNRIAALARDGGLLPRERPASSTAPRHADAGPGRGPCPCQLRRPAGYRRPRRYFAREHTLLAAANAKLYLDRGFTSLNSMASASRASTS